MSTTTNHSTSRHDDRRAEALDWITNQLAWEQHLARLHTQAATPVAPDVETIVAQVDATPAPRRRLVRPVGATATALATAVKTAFVAHVPTPAGGLIQFLQHK